MKTVIEHLSNGNDIKYKIVNNTAYHFDTEDTIVDILEKAREEPKTRLRFYYGDVKTGRDWGDIHDQVGYIGRSTGEIKIPLIIYNTRSYGGGALLDDCIVKIETSRGKRVLYEHPNYHKEVGE